MEVVTELIVVGCLMTLQADAIAGEFQFQAVWLMTVTAGHPGVMHLALYERAVDVDFVLDLTVGVVQALVQESGQVVIQ